MKGFREAYGLYSAMDALEKGKRVFAFFVNDKSGLEVRDLAALTVYQLTEYRETMEFYYKDEPEEEMFDVDA